NLLSIAVSLTSPESAAIFICSVLHAWQHFVMSRIVGIDLGTTNSLVATVDAAIPLVIAAADGSRLTPSVVHVPGRNEPAIVGRKANHVRVVNPSETVYSIKRFIGRRGSEISREEMLVTYPIRGGGAGPVTVQRRRRRPRNNRTAWPSLEARGDFGRGAQEIERRCGGVFRRGSQPGC